MKNVQNVEEKTLSDELKLTICGEWVESRIAYTHFEYVKQMQTRQQQRSQPKPNTLR